MTIHREQASTKLGEISEDQIEFDADAIMSPRDPEPVHQLHIAESLVGQQTDIPNPQEVEHALDVRHHREQSDDADLCTEGLDDGGVERHRALTEQHRSPNQTKLLEQHAGSQPVLAPGLQRRGDQ
ncbi:hypothetical protein MF271_23095 (plasmid) [Deinococcus sp. KNUC1210]|uniref:hypothetical protein n=1 Tax=Deinococcus sp. KNUC1210 TaxID=2917691 RepID=UPI001EEFFC83|nr:hypothetical protein [Deinococcus sp. KNUC1210]ULH18348.1 hypothetical protein MF271_23095 [Deinococcus sp. KNUC1210]